MIKSYILVSEKLPSAYIGVLKRVADIFYNSNAKWFFMSGTLLSIIRGEFIPGDIDIGIINHPGRKAIINYMLEKGFKYVHGFGDEHTGLQDTFEKDGITIDVHKIYYSGATCYHCAWDGEKTGWMDCEMVKYDFTQIETCDIITPEISYCIPLSPALYLIQHFGVDWKTPKKEWHFAKSCPNSWYTGIIKQKIQSVEEALK